MSATNTGAAPSAGSLSLSQRDFHVSPLCWAFADWRVDWAVLVHLPRPHTLQPPSHRHWWLHLRLRIISMLGASFDTSLFRELIKSQNSQSKMKHPSFIPPPSFLAQEEKDPQTEVTNLDTQPQAPLRHWQRHSASIQPPVWASKFAILDIELWVQLRFLQSFVELIKNRSGDARAEH